MRSGSAIAALVAAMIGMSPSAGAKPVPRVRETPEPATVPTAALAASRCCPESVLARVGSVRAITREDLARALARSEPPLGPDSSRHTPEQEERFLELLIDRELLAEAAGREPWVSTPEETGAVEAIRDRMVLSAMLAIVLDQTRAGMAARGDSAADDSQVGIVARERALARSEVTYDSALIERLAKAWAALPRPVSDSSLAAQIRMLEEKPRVLAEDLGKAIATGALGDYRVGDLLESWSHLSAAFRPRVENPDQIKDLVMNGLFERWLRLAADDRGLGDRPEVVAAVTRAREDLAIERMIEREVTSQVAWDSAAVRRFYEAHAEEWELPLRVRLVSMSATGRAEAARMAAWLRDREESERLEKLARGRGLDYVTEVSATSDSALFARALAAGVDAVFGPELRGSEWWVGRVTAVLPGRPRTFAEMRPVVEGRWHAREEERRLHELCARLRDEIGVRIEPGAPGSASFSGREP